VPTFKVTAVASSAAAPYTLTFFLPLISTVTPFQVTGNEAEIVALPLVAFSGPSKGYSIVRQNTGYNDTLIFFMRSAVTENFFSPAGKCILSNSREYSPSDTGKESSNEEPTHTSSPGAALPVIVITSPGLTTSGSTFNSVTLALVIETGIEIKTEASTKVSITIVINIASPLKVPGFIT